MDQTQFNSQGLGSTAHLRYVSVFALTMVVITNTVLVVGFVALGAIIAGTATVISLVVLSPDPGTPSPTLMPSEAPTVSPSEVPTASPTEEPTAAPTMAPVPTFFPSFRPTVKTPSKVTRAPTLAPTTNSSLVEGYWWWTWDRTTTAPVDTNLGKFISKIFPFWSSNNNPHFIAIAFSGWANITIALEESAQLYPYLTSTCQNVYISVGGGNKFGYWTLPLLEYLNNAITSQQLQDYTGIAYDIEVLDSGLTHAFTESFAIARNEGLKVLVTVSHSSPYGLAHRNTTEAAIMMSTFFADENIDYLSPQLYSTGEEYSNDYSITTPGTVTWADYANAVSAVVPSIVDASMYADAQTYFAAQGVPLSGFVQWQQV